MVLTKKFNLTNHILKVLSLVLGFLLWFYVLNSEPVTVQKDFEIEMVLPKNVAFKQLPVKKVSVTLKGARTFIDTLLKQENKIFIDLSKEKLSLKKQHKHYLKQKNIPVPFNVEVLEIRPRTLLAKFEKKLSKALIVKPKFIGELDKGLQIKEYSVEPKTIRVSGPRSVLKKLEFIESAPIDVSSFEDEGSFVLNFSKFDERINLLDQENVTFRYEIKSKDSNLTLQNIPILFLSSDQNFAVKQKFVAIDVLVSEEVSKNLKRGDIKVIAEIPTDFKGKKEIELSAQLPKGVIVQKIHPAKVVVRRKKKK
jgi:YbbR domain-containing protein